MPLGLKNVGQTFQRFMDNILAGILNLFIYLDDILVASPTVAEQKVDLRREMDRLSQHGLVINKEKCQLFKSTWWTRASSGRCPPGWRPLQSSLLLKEAQ